jgi:hypothetical protein
MKRNAVIIALGLFSAVANAGVTCKIEIAADPSNQGDRNKVLFEVPVPPSPSNDVNDPSRKIYVVVKRDLSRASILPNSQEETYKKHGAGADSGNFLVSLQETVVPTNYFLAVFQLDRSGHWKDYLNSKANVIGALLPGKPQAEQVLILDLPKAGFALVCASEQ